MRWRIVQLFGILALLVSSIATLATSHAQTTPQNTIYLPLVARNWPWPSPFGVETTALGDSRVAEQARLLGARWLRINFLSWKEIEATPGTYNWNTAHIQQFEAQLAAAAAANLTPMVVIDDAPAWATIVARGCAPIRPERLGNFASFVQQLVRRYQGQVRYWEFGNEPDVSVQAPTENDIFGCWGDPNDPFYGGAYYGEMLKRIYPAVKAADPSAQVIIGGLLLDSPNSPGTNRPENFFEGILRSGAGNSFDIVAYHAYTYWDPNVIDTDLAHPKWGQRGGALIGKLNFLRDTMRRYNVNKPVIMNEGGLLCFRQAICPAGNQFYEAQSNQLVRLYARTMANNMLGSIWYTLEGPGWQDGGLLDPQQQPRPAFNTMQFLARRLLGTTYAGSLSNGQVEGYAFTDGVVRYHIYWLNSRGSSTFAAPAGARFVYTRLGQQSAADTSLTITADPIIVQIGGS